MRPIFTRPMGRLAQIGTGRLALSPTSFSRQPPPTPQTFSLVDLAAMSRRTAVVEEFDDDTDLPLPNRPLPNKGLRGAILAELSDEDESDDDVPPPRNPTAGPASPSQIQFKAPQTEQGLRTVTDITPYKKCVRRVRCAASLELMSASYYLALSRR